MVFENSLLDPIGVYRKIEFGVSEFLAAKAKRCAAASSDCKWSLPPDGFIKVNVNGSFKDGLERGGIGVVVDGFSGRCESTSAFMSEALALRKALLMVRSLNLSNVLVESDCMKLVQVVKNATVFADWKSSIILEDIVVLLKSCAG